MSSIIAFWYYRRVYNILVVSCLPYMWNILSEGCTIFSAPLFEYSFLNPPYYSSLTRYQSRTEHFWFIFFCSLTLKNNNSTHKRWHMNYIYKLQRITTMSGTEKELWLAHFYRVLSGRLIGYILTGDNANAIGIHWTDWLHINSFRM